MDLNLVREKFQRQFSVTGELFTSPGRINLIGEHTDYNGGFVFPGAIDKGMVAEIKPNGTDKVRAYAVDLDDYAEFGLQEEDAPDVTALMYIESSAISFYLDEGQMDHISFKQNPEYVLYPMNLIPDTQERILQGFVWNDTLRPSREQICDRRPRSSRRINVANLRKPTFPITERIDYDRRRLVENRMWKDRADRLTPDVIEWRNSCPSYKNRRK